VFKEEDERPLGFQRQKYEDIYFNISVALLPLSSAYL
jgi:hypothetical protein